MTMLRDVQIEIDPKLNMSVGEWQDAMIPLCIHLKKDKLSRSESADRRQKNCNTALPLIKHCGVYTRLVCREHVWGYRGALSLGLNTQEPLSCRVKASLAVW